MTHTPHEKGPTAAVTATGLECSNQHQDSSTRPTPKWQRVLRALVDRPNLNRFQAERDPAVRDHCLPSTIAELERRYGLRVDRRLVRVPGFGGGVAHLAEYALDDDERARAQQLLAGAARGRR